MDHPVKQDHLAYQVREVELEILVNPEQEVKMASQDDLENQEDKVKEDLEGR